MCSMMNNILYCISLKRLHYNSPEHRFCVQGMCDEWTEGCAIDEQGVRWNMNIQTRFDIEEEVILLPLNCRAFVHKIELHVGGMFYGVMYWMDGKQEDANVAERFLGKIDESAERTVEE